MSYIFNIFDASNFNQEVYLLGKIMGYEIRSLFDIVFITYWIAWLGENDLTSLGLIFLSCKVETVDNFGGFMNWKTESKIMRSYKMLIIVPRN